MTFYQKLEMLCKSRGTTVTALATELGFSSSAGTTITHTVEHHSRNNFMVVVWRNVFAITIPIK